MAIKTTVRSGDRRWLVMTVASMDHDSAGAMVTGVNDST